MQRVGVGERQGGGMRYEFQPLLLHWQVWGEEFPQLSTVPPQVVVL